MPFVLKNTILSGTNVFFIQKPPVVLSGKTKSMPSTGALRRRIRPSERLAEVRASSGRNATPSSLSFAVGFAVLEEEAMVPVRTTARTTTRTPSVDVRSLQQTVASDLRARRELTGQKIGKGLGSEEASPPP
jgi:hypothetical protein